MSEIDSSDSADLPSTRVIQNVASHRGISVTELEEPLFSVVDPDALNALFNATDGRVTFRYCGCEVTVAASGEVTVCDAE